MRAGVFSGQASAAVWRGLLGQNGAVKRPHATKRLLGAAAMGLSSVFVLSNALWLRGFRPPVQVGTASRGPGLAVRGTRA